jgi:hypothetical protein
VGAPATVTVRIDDAAPPAGGVTGFVPKISVNPLGPPDWLKVTAEENSPRDWTVTVAAPDPPGLRDIEDGATEILKSATPAVITTTTSAVCVSAPLVAVTRNVNGPVDALAPAVIVSVEVTVPPAGGVTGVGSVWLTSVGAEPTHAPARSTAALNPLIDVTVHVLVPLPPCAALIAAGAQAMLKSGTTAEVT